MPRVARRSVTASWNFLPEPSAASETSGGASFSATARSESSGCERFAIKAMFCFVSAT